MRAGDLRAYLPGALRRGFLLAVALHLSVFVPLRVWQPRTTRAIPGLAGPLVELDMVRLEPAGGGGGSPIAPGIVPAPPDEEAPAPAEMAMPVPVPASEAAPVAPRVPTSATAAGEGSGTGGGSGGSGSGGGSGNGMGTGGGGTGLIPPVPLSVAWIEPRPGESAENVNADELRPRRIRVLVDEHGRVMRAICEPEAPSSAADSAAISVARTIRFRPARLEGKPASAWTTVEIRVRR